ncbi:MAG: heparan-alpha-glucosaminide N-acetyltransferase domain-containing protein [Myxococcota bacterium]
MSERTSTMRRRRVLAIDLLRGGAVIAMIMVHTLWLYGDIPTQRDSWLGWVLNLLGKGTVSFLMAMGFSFMVSRDQSIFGSVRRGVLLMGIGYAMNVLKFIVPLVAGAVPDAFIAAHAWSRPLSTEQMAHLVLTGDILQLAGVCLLLMGFIRRWSSNKLTLLGWAAAFALGRHLLAGFRVGAPALDHGLDLLWGTEFNVYYPVFPWFCSILVGMFFGAWYRDQLEVDADEDRLFRGMLVMGLPLTVVGGGLVLAWPHVHFGDFFHLGAGGITYLVGLNLLIMWACR